MSAAETEALVRRYYDAFNRGDTETMLACLADHVVHDVNQGMRRHGKGAFGAFCAHMAKCYREQLRDMTIMVSADGRRAAAEFNVEGSYRQTDDGMPPALGQTYTLPAGTFFVVENGLITRVTTYYNLTDWLVQVSGDGERPQSS
ncbi:MAG: ketosteroid isomerase-related protein [Hyphomicrobiaceae bacterium]